MSERNEPRVWSRNARWPNSSSFITNRLTDEYVLDHHTAPQGDPMYDLRNRRWHDDWAGELWLGFRCLASPGLGVNAPQLSIKCRVAVAHRR